MSQIRQGDIYLYDTPDGGDIHVTNGEPVMDGGFESAVYLSFFGHDGSPLWMDEYMSESEKLPCRLMHFIKGAPKTVMNMRRAEELAKHDLQWLVNDGHADRIIPTMTSIDRNAIQIVSEIRKNGSVVYLDQRKITWAFEQNDPAHARL